MAQRNAAAAARQRGQQQEPPPQQQPPAAGINAVTIVDLTENSVQPPTSLTICAMTRSQRVLGKTWPDAPQASARQESAIQWDEQHKVREEVADMVRQAQKSRLW